MLSRHFSIAEMSVTDTGIQNVIGATQIANATRLCLLVLEPLRAAAGTSLRINSGIRGAEINAAVGGHPASAHLSGRAADVVPASSVLTAHELAVLLAQTDIPYDKAIFEERARARGGMSAWLHVQVREVDREPRRENLISPSEGVFRPWTPG